MDEVTIADPSAAWAAAGFRVRGDQAEVGTVRLRLEGPGPVRGITGWSLRDAAGAALDGLPTSLSERPPAAGATHPNGVVALDHLVVIPGPRPHHGGARGGRPRPAPGAGGAHAAGAPRQAFFRMGEVVLEVGRPRRAPASAPIGTAPPG